MNNYYTAEDDIERYWELRHKEWLENPNWGNYPYKQKWFDERFSHLLPPKPEETINNRTPIGRVLDYGCGCGLYALPLVQRFRSYVGFDTSESALKAARTYYKTNHPEELQRMWFNIYTGKPGHWETNVQGVYDLIISITVLQHQPIPYRLAMIENIKRLLKPNGLYIGLEMAGNSLAMDMPPMSEESWIEAWKPWVMTKDVPLEHPEWSEDNVYVARR